MLKEFQKTVQKAAGVLGYEIARKRGYTLDHDPLIYKDGDFTTVNNHDFMLEPEFLRCWNKAMALIQDARGYYNYPWRFHMLMWLADRAFGIPGDYVECGVHRGVSLMGMVTHLNRHQQQVRDFFGFDTFCGIDEKYITEPERKQAHYKDITKIYRENYAEVADVFKDYSNVHLIRGPIPGSLYTNDCKAINNVAFLHIDMNNAMPEKAALEYFWTKISSGGYVVSDDFGQYGLGIQHKMWCEFAKSVNREIFYVPGTGQGVIIK